MMDQQKMIRTMNHEQNNSDEGTKKHTKNTKHNQSKKMILSFSVVLLFSISLLALTRHVMGVDLKLLEFTTLPKTQPAGAQSSTQCLVCEAVLTLVIDELENNATIANIAAEFAQICAKAPSRLQSACKLLDKVFVATLGALPGTLDREDYTPWSLCTMMSECKVSCCVSDAPEQIKLSLTGTANEIGVSWITATPPKQPCVRYAITGLSPQIACGQSSTYTVGGWLGSIQFVVLPNLKPRTTYSYIVGSNETNAKWSSPFTFTNGPFADPSTNRPMRFAVIGDMGASNVSDPTIAHLVQLAQTRGYDILLHDGDIAYADGVQMIFDEYGRKVQNFTAIAPTLLTIGNHEAIFFEGVPYQKRFIAPVSNAPEPLYWSANVELVHIVGLDSESQFDTAYISDAQINWLRSDLAAVNRSVTPWIVVMLHRPLYCTSSHVECEVYGQLLQKAVEALFVEYDVDFVIQAHRHNYESFWPTNYGKRVNKGPVYVVNGSAGCRELISHGFTKTAPDNSRFRSYDYGYGMLEVNATALVWRFHRDSDNAVVDEFVIA
jgi:hypothetical protein